MAEKTRYEIERENRYLRTVIRAIDEAVAKTDPSYIRENIMLQGAISGVCDSTAIDGNLELVRTSDDECEIGCDTVQLFMANRNSLMDIILKDIQRR